MERSCELPLFETFKKAIDFKQPAFAPEGDPEPFFRWMADAGRETFGDLDYLALFVFGLLALFLVFVGIGKLLAPLPTPHSAARTRPLRSTRRDCPSE